MKTMTNDVMSLLRHPGFVLLSTFDIRASSFLAV